MTPEEIEEWQGKLWVEHAIDPYPDPAWRDAMIPRIVAALRAAENDALERAALTVEAEEKNYPPSTYGPMHVGLATRMCAVAVRKLKHV